MNIVAIVQARLSSKRLPGKVITKIANRPMIEILLARLNKSKRIKKIIVATTTDKIDDKLEKIVQQQGIFCFRGNNENVLKRFYHAAKKSDADIVVRITGDCPLIDSVIIDNCIQKLIENKADYCSNIIKPSFPDGLDTEVFTFDLLKKTYKNTKNKNDIEHVTPYMIRSDKIKKVCYSNRKDYSDLRITVDQSDDLKLIKKIISYFSPNIFFNFEDIIKLFKDKPKLLKINSHIKRNEGMKMGKGQKLYKRAKELIPGGNMLLSKRPEMFLPKLWPSYFSKSKDCYVWDLDNNKFADLSIMGIGTNILGYGNQEVDKAVHNTIRKGNLSTLNCPEEVFLAERLVELHPWSEMIRFARTGGEANSIAIRIARAASGRQNVAFCGYHGWHDWYLSANLKSKDSLNTHLLPDLKTKGVPKALKDTVFPFLYNDFEALKKIVKERNIGVIKMEVERNIKPKNNFLQKVRKIADENNIVLVFDECTTGFRETFGGLHLKYGVNPDMVILGKALGNGYAITAILGKKKIMEAAQSSFISSTFWTERIGPTAGLKTLEIMEKKRSWDVITKIGRKIVYNWEKISKNHDIKIEISGIPALSSFKFLSKNNLLYKTFITQEMLKRGFLASNCIYASIKHSSKILNSYFENLDEIFKTLSECEKGKDIEKLLETQACHSGFNRIN